MMRSALYYPHTEIHSLPLLKTSLLLWDSLEFIAPFPDYTPQYDDKLTAKSFELLALKGHYPTDEEKKNAHQQIKNLVKKGLDSSFYLDEGYYRHGRVDYEIWPQKLLPETWEMLEKAQLAGRPGEPGGDPPLRLFTGLAVMSILADCCAGMTRRRITDRGEAYAKIASLLNPKLSRSTFDYAGEHHHELVHTSLQIVDAGAIEIERLIAFREREVAEHGYAIRGLRHRYVEKIESYLTQIAACKGRKSDEDQIKTEFERDMRDDYQALRDALKMARKEVLTSREILSAGVASLGVIAGLATGMIPAAFSGLVTLASAPVAVGGLLGSRNKYLASRRTIMEKYPMAYLLELEHPA